MASFDVAADPDLIKALTAISISAAAAIRRAQADPGISIKADGSPVTAADQAADAVITDGLRRLDAGLPVVSEERAELDRPSIVGKCFILVDPLDGTREFIAGRDEYTINIALVCDGAPVLGIITAPALGTIWRGIVGRAAEKLEFSPDGTTTPPQPIRVRARPPADLSVMVSRSHLDPRTRSYLDGLGGVRPLACGSSIKFCRVAEGTADLYPRLGPTRDWDVAAGHAIVAAAGGKVTAPDGAAIVYATPGLLIPAFVATGAASVR